METNNSLLEINTWKDALSYLQTIFDKLTKNEVIYKSDFSYKTDDDKNAKVEIQKKHLQIETKIRINNRNLRFFFSPVYTTGRWSDGFFIFELNDKEILIINQKDKQLPCNIEDFKSIVDRLEFLVKKQEEITKKPIIKGQIPHNEDLIKALNSF
jgi:hypothetical protein